MTLFEYLLSDGWSTTLPSNTIPLKSFEHYEKGDELYYQYGCYEGNYGGFMRGTATYKEAKWTQYPYYTKIENPFLFIKDEIKHNCRGNILGFIKHHNLRIIKHKLNG